MRVKHWKKLYEEEQKKKEGDEADLNHEFIDYDNILFDEDVVEVVETPTVQESGDKVKRFQCDKCNFKTANKQSFDNHKMSCQNVLKCNKCKFSAQHESLLQQHKNEIHKPKPSKKCSDCEYSAKTENSLQQHRINTHGAPNIDGKNKEDLLQCDFCEYSTSDPYDINLHEHKTHKSNTIKCNMCDFTAKSEDILKKHHQVAMGHKKKIACKFYIQGRCKNGRFCKFEHKMSFGKFSSSGNTRQSNNVNRNINQNRGNMQQCKYFENCQQFPNCGYMHFEVCKFQDKCTYGERCHFVHINFLDMTPSGSSRW